MWIGLDDTDGPNAGCTTFALTEVIGAARTCGLDLIGEPRLVRLNPNIPFKTRGNAALAARFGRGYGPRRRQGWMRGEPIWSLARGAPPRPAAREEFLERAWRAVRASSSLGTPGTDPAMVAISRTLGPETYREAVSRLMPLDLVEGRLADAQATVRVDSARQGLVGAAAAVSWPARRVTWELIAYRDARRVGLPRRVVPASVQRAQRRYPALFLCHDGRTRRLLVAPHTQCPILFGLRSTQRDALPAAMGEVESEPVDRWLIFRTNQGTGDHLVRRSIPELRPFDAARIAGTVVETPQTGRGGHVRFVIEDSTHARLQCIAFEPTKTLPRVAGSLCVGDRIEVWGGRALDPTFRIEGLRLVSSRARRGPARAPSCPVCGSTMRSLGVARGYRCWGCHHRLPPEAARWPLGSAFAPGTYHPTPSARRHLAPRGPEVFPLP
jgi:tRNA(Ile2)-agmatinylcytidine synthase